MKENPMRVNLSVLIIYLFLWNKARWSFHVVIMRPIPIYRRTISHCAWVVARYFHSTSCISNNADMVTIKYQKQEALYTTVLYKDVRSTYKISLDTFNGFTITEKNITSDSHWESLKYINEEKKSTHVKLLCFNWFWWNKAETST